MLSHLPDASKAPADLAVRAFQRQVGAINAPGPGRFRANTARSIRDARHFAPVECPLKHYFTPGIYTREISMPAGAFVIGKIHLTEHPNIISKGRVTVMCEDHEPITYTAPATFISKAGIQKTLLVHEDTIWTTIHATTETDLDKIRDSVVVDDYATYLERTKQ